MKLDLYLNIFNEVNKILVERLIYFYERYVIDDSSPGSVNYGFRKNLGSVNCVFRNEKDKTVRTKKTRGLKNELRS